MRVRIERLRLAVARKQLEGLMEIRGLGARFASAKGRIAEMRDATTKFEETATPFLSDLDDVTNQIAAMHADLKFEAETLGNGSSTVSGGSSTVTVTSKPVSAHPAETAHLAETR